MKDSSQTPEQNDWQEFKPLFGGGKIKICDTLRAVTPFGGLSVLIEFLARIGLVEQLKNRPFYQPESPNHYDPGQILVGFMIFVPCAGGLSQTRRTGQHGLELAAGGNSANGALGAGSQLASLYI